MLAEKFQPALSKAIHESLVKVIPENMPPITNALQIDGVLCISMDSNKSKKIVVKIHDTIQPIATDTGSGRSSPWQIPLEKIQAAHERFLEFNGTEGGDTPTSVPGSPSAAETPIDLRGARTVPDVLDYTAQQLRNGALSSPLTNGDSSSETGSKFSASSPSIPASGSIPSPSGTAAKNGVAAQPKTPNEIQCKVCSKTISGGLPALQTHAQDAHQRYVCRFCYNTFSLRCNLKRHERLHAGLKPYRCNKCDRSFTRGTDLKYHMARHCAEDRVNNGMPNLVPSNGAPSSIATTESIPDVDMEMNSFDDSDSERALMIDTQSEGEEEDISLPANMQTDETSTDLADVGIELTSEPVTSVAQNMKTDVTPIEISPRPDASATPTPSQSSTGSTTGSRKRKIGKPTKVVEISDDAYDDFDISNMYFESAGAKAKRAQQGQGNSGCGSRKARVQRAIADLQDEPENLVIKQRSATPPPIHIQPTKTSPYDLSNASNTLSQIATALQQNTSTPYSSALGQHTSAILSSHGFSPVQVLGLRDLRATPEMQNQRLATMSQSFPTATPILITPERYHPQKPTAPASAEATTYRPQPSKPKSNANVPHSVTPVSKSKIENVTNEAIDDNKEFQCVEMGCNETYLGFSAYEDHCMIRHGRYPCKYCKQTFSGKNNRTRHMRCHLGAKTYTCPDCNKNFSRPDSMREHQFIHTLSYQEDKCRNCGAAFDKKNMLLAHLKQCYRHKMETGKSTKFIDETPAYLNKDNTAPSVGAAAAAATKKTRVAGSVVDDSLKPLKPLKLENFPAFRHIAPALDSAVPSLVASGKSPVVATVLSLADARGSPTMTTPLVGASRRKVASPLNLSGGTLTTASLASSPLTIPTVVANSSAVPSPLVIAPITSNIPSSVVAAAARISSGGLVSSGKSSPASIKNPASPLVIAPESPNAIPAPIVVASLANTSMAYTTTTGSAPTSAPSSAPSSPKRYDSPVFPSPVTASSEEATDLSKDVLTAVKSLVKKRNGDCKTAPAKDQNANTQPEEVEAGGDE